MGRSSGSGLHRRAVSLLSMRDFLPFLFILALFVVAPSDDRPNVSYLSAVLQSNPHTALQDSLSVRVVPEVQGSWAQTTWEGDRFLILIDNDVPRELLNQVLAHEWAHVLVWDVPGECDHGPIWGVAFARAFSVLQGEQYCGTIPTPSFLETDK